jgi:hypothetical protein
MLIHAFECLGLLLLPSMTGAVPMKRLVLLFSNSIFWISCAICFEQISRFALDTCQRWGIYLWEVSYEYGFIKRGLIGAINNFLQPDQDLASLNNTVAHLNLGCLYALCAGLIFTCRRIFSKNSISLRVTYLFLASALFLSPAWSNLAWIAGYPDLFIIILSFLGLFALTKKRPSWHLAWIIAAIGPLVHEMFLFLWPSVIILKYLHIQCKPERDAPLKLFLLFLIPIASYLFLSIAHSSEAVFQSLDNSILIPKDTLDGLKRYQFGQTLSSSIGVMLRLWRNYLGNAIAAIIFFCGAPLLVIVIISKIVGLAAPARLESTKLPSDCPKEISEKVLLGIAAAFPLLILLFAWDLSRLLCLTTFSTFMCVLYMANRTIGVSASFNSAKPLLASALLLTLVSFNLYFGPAMLDVYFDKANVIPAVNNPVLLPGRVYGLTSIGAIKTFQEFVNKKVTIKQ